jgi:hypothetical protein
MKLGIGVPFHESRQHVRRFQLPLSLCANVAEYYDLAQVRMKKIHFQNVAKGGPLCGVPFGDHFTGDLEFLTCRRCGSILLFRILYWFLEEAEHRFCGGRCERCGCSESAVAHFGWPCR